VTQRTVSLILGGPGAGKTSHLIGREDQAGVIGKLLAEGAQPSDIAYVSFTRKAADEAATRAVAQLGCDRADLPHFRTLHSMAYHLLGVQAKSVMQRADYKEVATLLGVTFTGYHDPADGPASPSREGDLILQWLSYAAARQLELKAVWHQSGEIIEWALVKLFAETVAQYKRDTHKLDFSDMLTQALAARVTCPTSVAIIDEAQDLSTAQWALARSLFRPARLIYLAGDDDQAIHAWAGADVEQLFRLKAKPQVLPVSHRLPREVFELATTVAKRIRQRFPKAWEPAAHSGHVHHLAGLEHLDLRQPGTWLLLARNRCFTKDYVRLCREQGVPFATVEGPAIPAEHVRAIVVWERLRAGKRVPAADVREVARYIPRWSFGLEVGAYTLAELQAEHGLRAEGIWHDALERLPLADREYYMHCLRNGYRLQDPPPVHVGTIHSVKGGEDDHVVLRTDLTYRTQQGLEADPYNEARVFYVGVTRAKRHLYIIDAQEGAGYLI
jgi:superfamily I DNA/RNA helicase